MQVFTPTDKVSSGNGFAAPLKKKCKFKRGDKVRPLVTERDRSTPFRDEPLTKTRRVGVKRWNLVPQETGIVQEVSQGLNKSVAIYVSFKDCLIKFKPEELRMVKKKK